MQFAALHMSPCGTLLPRANAAACLQLAKADFASSSQHVREGQRIAALDAEVDALQRQALALGAEPTADVPPWALLGVRIAARPSEGLNQDLSCSCLMKGRPQAFRSVIRMIATTLPSLNACSFVSLLQVQTKFFLAVKVLPSCSIRSSPSVM
jgi:hypothetical protein